MSRICILVMVVFASYFIGSNEAQAQRRVPHYRTGNTLSPYIGLFQSNNSGGVNNYFTQVRPQIQFQNQLNQLQSYNNLNYGYGRQQPFGSRQQTLMLQDTIQRTLEMTLRGGVGPQPASAGRFMDTSRFYPISGTPHRGR